MFDTFIFMFTSMSHLHSLCCQRCPIVRQHSVKMSHPLADHITTDTKFIIMCDMVILCRSILCWGSCNCGFDRQFDTVDKVILM